MIPALALLGNDGEVSKFALLDSGEGQTPIGDMPVPADRAGKKPRSDFRFKGEEGGEGEEEEDRDEDWDEDGDGSGDWGGVEETGANLDGAAPPGWKQLSRTFTGERLARQGSKGVGVTIVVFQHSQTNDQWSVTYSGEHKLRDGVATREGYGRELASDTSRSLGHWHEDLLDGLGEHNDIHDTLVRGTYECGGAYGLGCVYVEGAANPRLTGFLEPDGDDDGSLSVREGAAARHTDAAHHRAVEMALTRADEASERGWRACEDNRAAATAAAATDAEADTEAEVGHTTAAKRFCEVTTPPEQLLAPERTTQQALRDGTEAARYRLALHGSSYSHLVDRFEFVRRDIDATVEDLHQARTFVVDAVTLSIGPTRSMRDLHAAAGGNS